MTHEEYTALINKIIQSPDTATETAETILREIKTDTERISALEAQHTEDETRIRNLQTENIRLFLSQTGGQQEDPEELDPADAILAELEKR